MSIVRTVKNTNYTTISNVILNDDRLSWKARGIAAYLLSKPDDWRVNYEHLVSAAPDGKHTVLAAMKELEECGYITRHRFQGEDGRWRSEVVLHETPSTEIQQSVTGEKPTSGKPTSGKPTSGKPTSGKPTSGKPTVGKSVPIPIPENQSLKPIPDDQSLTTQGGEGEGEKPTGTKGGEGKKQRRAAPAEPRQALAPEKLALKAELVDAGLSDQKAYEVAFHYPEDFTRGWLAATLDDLDAGKVESIGVLPWRLAQGRNPPQRYQKTDYSLDALEAAQRQFEARQRQR